jgi:hypothetical protein
MPTMSVSAEPVRRAQDAAWPAGLRAVVAAAAAASTAAGVSLASQHPLSAWAAVAAWCAMAILSFVRPAWGLGTLLGLLPVSGLAPWSGWLVVEEVDLLLLALVAGGYARLAREGAAAKRLAMPLLSGVLLAAAAVSVLWSMARGVAAADGWAAGWWQAYHEPLNSVRLAKPLLMALLVWPLWQAIDRGPSRHAVLAWGMTAGLALASLSVLAERHAFAGLTNFSSDYRATGPFWEMHVGGAALDAYLSLALPFAFVLVARTERAWLWFLAAAPAAVAAYAALATFSRGVYVAVPLALAVLWWRESHLDRARRTAAHEPARAGAWSRWFILVGFGAAVVWMFPSSGYRGLIAWWGVVALMLFLARPLQRLDAPARRRLVTWTLAALAAVLAVWALWDKGAYLAYGLAALVCAGAVARLWWPMRPAPTTGAALMALAAYFALLPAAVLVAWHWGAMPGLVHMLPPLLGVLIALVGASTSVVPAWPDRWQWQLGWAGALGIVGLAVAVGLGGARMSERFATVGEDWEGRLEHWRSGLRLLTPWDVLVGKGQGRFMASLYVGGDPDARVGDHRLIEDASGESHLRLSGGRHVLDWGEFYRVSQRLAPSAVPVVLRLKMRTEQAAQLHVEVCAKQLLYDDGCVTAKHSVKQRAEGAGAWRQLQLPFTSRPLDAGTWWAPRPLVFSVAVANRGAVIDVDELSLLDASGRELLLNGDFSSGLSRWFFSSDRHHLPWHIKSLPLHVLFDQGVFGLVIHALLAIGALWRVTVGSGRGHPLAPPLAAGLVGLLVIGLFDSVIDAPRIAFVYYLLLLVALTLPRPPRREAALAAEPAPKKRRRSHRPARG